MATIDNDFRPGHASARPRGQQQQGTIEVARGTESAAGNARPQALTGLAAKKRLIDFRGDVTRRNRIHADAVLGQLQHKGAGQLTQSDLGRRVRPNTSAYPAGQDRRDVDPVSLLFAGN